MKMKQLGDLVTLLSKAGIEAEKADSLVIKVAGIAQSREIPVITALREFADSGANPDSINYHLHIALQNISTIELGKLTTLLSTLP